MCFFLKTGVFWQALARRFLAMDGDIVGNIRFGKIMETLDKVAENTALAYVHRFYPSARVVTAAVDSIVLRNPADTKHNMVFSAQINHVGKSSMEVGIRIECLSSGSSHLASCYFTMVERSTDTGEAKSLPLPPLHYNEDIDKRRYQKAELRRQAYRDTLAKAEECLHLKSICSLKNYTKCKRLQTLREFVQASWLLNQAVEPTLNRKMSQLPYLAVIWWEGDWCTTRYEYLRLS